VKSISIDCHEALGSLLSANTNGINVAFDSFDQTDIRKTVNLRNLMIQGFDTGTAGINIIGAAQGSNVNIEDCLINGIFASPGNGITDARSRGMLVVNNTTIRNFRG
jgi:hypothetical protein